MSQRHFLILFLTGLGVVLAWSLLLMFRGSGPSADADATNFLKEAGVGLVFVGGLTWAFFVRESD